MKILCLNGWGGKLHDAVVNWLPEADPDVLCLQEVTETPQSPAEVLHFTELDDALPQRANFFSEVAAALPDHNALFCPAQRGDLWLGDQPVRSHWGLATFVRRRFPIIGQHQGYIHGRFNTDGFGDKPHARNAHMVRLFDPDSRQTLCIGHLHGLHDTRGKEDTPARAVQAERLLKLVTDFVDDKEALVLCGDFNLLPESETFRQLAAIGLQDLVTSRGFTSTRTALYEKPVRYADYLLVNEHIEVQQFNVLQTPVVSDHCPLVLEATPRAAD